MNRIETHILTLNPPQLRKYFLSCVIEKDKYRTKVFFNILEQQCGKENINIIEKKTVINNYISYHIELKVAHNKFDHLRHLLTDGLASNEAVMIDDLFHNIRYTLRTDAMPHCVSSLIFNIFE